MNTTPAGPSSTSARFSIRTAGRAWAPVLAASILGVSILAAVQARPVAAPQRIALTPPVVAIVDIAKLMNGLDELKDRNTELGQRSETYKKELTELSDKGKNLENQLNTTVPKDDYKTRANMTAEMYLTRASLQSKKDAYMQLLDLDNGDVIRDLYTKSQAAIAALAKRDGYDLVLMDDRSITLPPRAPVKDYNGAIESKRVLYANEALNVTDRLITVMNNDYHSSTKTTSPAAPALTPSAPPTIPAKGGN